MTGMVQWGMRQAAEVANQMMSVERVLEYTSLPSEPNLRDKGVLPKKKKKYKQVAEEALTDIPPDWPSHGRIEFKDVVMKYSEDTPLVIRGLTMTIESSEKVYLTCKIKPVRLDIEIETLKKMTLGWYCGKNGCRKIIANFDFV